MAKIDINSDQWCDIVFENRNTSFGAFVLRTESSKRHLRALIIAAILFVFAIMAPILVKEVMKNVKKGDTMVRQVDYLDQVKKTEKQEKPHDEIPQQKQEEQVRATIAFPPPIVRPDAEVKSDTLPNQKHMFDTHTAIGTENRAGTNDVNVAVNNGITNSGPAPKVEEDNKVYSSISVQVQPNYPGGTKALYDYLSKNITYPASARESGVQGQVLVAFVVGKNGKISEVKVLKSLDPACDEEAVRVVNSMPAWSPGKQGDKSVKVSMKLPIVFRLD